MSEVTQVVHGLHLVLCDGFRGHTVSITVDGREVYHRSDVTTDVVTCRADVVDVPVGSRTARVALRAAPGDLAGLLEVDVAAHPHVGISLVGDGTVSFEITR